MCLVVDRGFQFILLWLKLVFGLTQATKAQPGGVSLMLPTAQPPLSPLPLFTVDTPAEQLQKGVPGFTPSGTKENLCDSSDCAQRWD